MSRYDARVIYYAPAYPQKPHRSNRQHHTYSYSRIRKVLAPYYIESVMNSSPQQPWHSRILNLLTGMAAIETLQLSLAMVSNMRIAKQKRPPHEFGPKVPRYLKYSCTKTHTITPHNRPRITTRPLSSSTYSRTSISGYIPYTLITLDPAPRYIKLQPKQNKRRPIEEEGRKKESQMRYKEIRIKERHAGEGRK